MNKLKTTLIFIFILVLSLPMANAQKTVTKEKALAVLLRTNRVIGHAHMAVTRGKVYTGNLGKAVRHERFAKALYEKGNYIRSIQHSRKARLLALEAVKANRVKPSLDATITPEETELMGTVSDEELEEELTKANAPVLTDEELVKNNNLNLEVK